MRQKLLLFGTWLSAFVVVFALLFLQAYLAQLEEEKWSAIPVSTSDRSFKASGSAAVARPKRLSGA
ncbi:hypothetical protein [Burkholderia ambifaria]|uniref:hypothetical protein n=1 Tax=Burkholderia ambifaria TaxID=152480 RepID=UPI001588BF44|nr:hypothetical protein [Burkholderia ambifaria]